MAGEIYRFMETGEDAEKGVTLEILRDRVQRAIDDGVPLDTPIIEEYSPQFLAHGIYLKKPVDVTTLSFEQLRVMALRNNAEDSVRGWNEIERRIEVFALAGQD